MFDSNSFEANDKSLAVVKNIATESLRNKSGKLPFCYDTHHNLHSSMLTLTYKDTAYYQFGATDPGFRSSSASAFLVLNSIKTAFESNIDFFDMVGINSPNRGDFKLSFNALPKPYFHLRGIFTNN